VNREVKKTKRKRKKGREIKGRKRQTLTPSKNSGYDLETKPNYQKLLSNNIPE